jgi:hypothetical protein
MVNIKGIKTFRPKLTQVIFTIVEKTNIKFKRINL